jgi:hypothetical protein
MKNIADVTSGKYEQKATKGLINPLVAPEQTTFLKKGRGAILLFYPEHHSRH